MELIKDMSQTALTTGERALRLFWDLVAIASERLREATGQPKPLPLESPPPSRRAPSVRPETSSPETPEPAEARRVQAPARGGVSKVKSRKKARAKLAEVGERPDQMVRVLELLAESQKAWVSAKELSDAGGQAGTPILPGNVRKVIRARGEGLIETRPRDGSRRGALEYRITEAGRRTLDA